jgi:hypothetical protein
VNVREEFGNYVLRSVDAKIDRDPLARWIQQDSYHRGVFTPEFFLGEDPRSSYYAMEDHAGVIFFIRLSRAARVYMQFPPTTGDSQARHRLGHALLEGLAFLEVGLSRAGCEQWAFDSHAPGLRHLAMHRMGFRALPDDLVRGIRPPEGQKAQEEALAGPQQGE